MARTSHAISLEIDRYLSLSLSNYEFEILVNIISDSENPEQTALNMINCGVTAVLYVINISKD